MDVYSKQSEDLLTLLLATGLPTGMLTSRILIISLFKREGSTLGPHIGRITRWLNQDNVLFGFTVLFSLVAIVPALINHTISDVVTYLGAITSELPFFGILIDLMLLMHIVAPFMVWRDMQVKQKREARLMERFAR